MNILSGVSTFCSGCRTRFDSFDEYLRHKCKGLANPSFKYDVNEDVAWAGPRCPVCKKAVYDGYPNMTHPTCADE